MDSKDTIQKYISLYMKRWIIGWTFVATLCAVPILVLGIKHHRFPFELFLPYAVEGLLLLFHKFLSRKFPKSIRIQEEMHAISFSDHGAKQIPTRRTGVDEDLYLSDDWIILAGSYALYKDHITRATCDVMESKVYYYSMNFWTRSDQIYTLGMENRRGLKEVEQWLEANGIDLQRYDEKGNPTEKYQF